VLAAKVPVDADLDTSASAAVLRQEPCASILIHTAAHNSFGRGGKRSQYMSRVCQFYRVIVYCCNRRSKVLHHWTTGPQLLVEDRDP